MKLNARMTRAAEQGLRKNRFKIEISIKTFGYFVKFEERKKINGLYRNITLVQRLDFRKKSDTLQWRIVQQTEKCLYCRKLVRLSRKCVR